MIFDDFAMVGLTSMIEPLRAANEISNQTLFSWELIGETHSEVMASANIAFEATRHLKDIDHIDYLIFLSPPIVRIKDANSIVHLPRLARHGMKLGAIS